MTIPTTKLTRTARRSGRWVPAALVALSLIPVLAGISRLVVLSGGPELLLPADPRSEASPVPVVLHVVSAIGFAIIGAFQFSAGIRRRQPRWHRRAGRVLVVLGLVVAFSALWLTLFYPARRTPVISCTCSGCWPLQGWGPASFSASPPSGTVRSPATVAG